MTALYQWHDSDQSQRYQCSNQNKVHPSHKHNSSTDHSLQHAESMQMEMQHKGVVDEDNHSMQPVMLTIPTLMSDCGAKQAE